MQHFVTRTSAPQQKQIDRLPELFGPVTIHQLTHNLDGLWVNIHLTANDGDWIVSIDRTGTLERTQ